MKILILQSSGRVDGNTARVVSIAEEVLEAEAALIGEPIQVETVHLSRQDICPCLGCRSCFNRGEETCPHKDGTLDLKSKMRAADGLVLAGPVYVNDVNGILKNWIDRLARVCHRPEFAGKTALLRATTGSTPARRTLRTMQVALSTWGYRIAASKWFRTGALLSVDEIRQCHSERIAQASRKLLEAIHTRRFTRPSFLSLLILRIQQAGWSRAAPDSIDHTYWKDKGWLDIRRTTFFFPHDAGRIKTALARLAGSVAAALYA